MIGMVFFHKNVLKCFLSYAEKAAEMSLGLADFDFG